jgi:uncharacterized membrane protein YkvA (DUF1232 family)
MQTEQRHPARIVGEKSVGPLEALQTWSKALRRDVVALWLAARDPRVPWYAKAMAGAVAAYALSPIDLVPDFIPVIGYLDDLIIVSLGIAIVVRLIPTAIMDDLRRRAGLMIERPRSRTAAVLIVCIWLALAVALILFALPLAKAWISRLGKRFV